MLLINRECTHALSLDTSCDLSVGKVYGEEDEKAYQIIAEYAGGIVELRTGLTKDSAERIFWDVIHEYEKGSKIYRF